MTSKFQVGALFLLSSLLFPTSLCYAPPLSSIYKIKSRIKQEQIIMKGEENRYARETKVDQNAKQREEIFSPLTLHYVKQEDRGGGDDEDLMKRVHSPLSPHPQLLILPSRGRKVGIQWNANNNSSANDTTTITTTTTTTTTTTITTTTTTTTTTHDDDDDDVSMIYSFVPSLYYSPSSSLSPPPSCSSSACKWLSSWQFIVVVCMTLTWLVGLMTLYCMIKTTRGKMLLEALSSLSAHDEQDQDEVQTKGIGYIDGSPGLRRCVFIEDEKDEDDEEDNEDNLLTSEFKDVRSKDNEEPERGGISRKTTPPRRGTYILQEASKEGVLEIGTYRLQEKEEEEEEVNREEMDEGKAKEVEYILEGTTYILQSERMGRGGTRIIGGGKRGYIGGIEGLYGIIGREELQGRGYGRLEGLRVHGAMGRGEVRGIRGGGRDGRIGGIEQLYEILQDEVTEGDSSRGGGDEDGVLLSVRDLVGTVGGGNREEKVRKESSREGGTGAKGKEWKDIGERRDKERGWKEERESEKGASGTKRRNREKRGDKKEEKREKIEVNASDIWERKRGVVRAMSGGVGEGSWKVNPPPSPKRAASFPMDHFLSSHIIPRKLSLILEE